MMLKLLRYGALTCLVAGIYAQDHLLYFFLAVHLAALSIGVFLQRKDPNAGSDRSITSLPEASDGHSS